MKRLFDFSLALALLMVLWPLIFAVALLVCLFLGQPILFCQQRPGLHGKPFRLYKFRTMSLERDQNGETLSDQERMTTFGAIIRKYSLDELPQLFNVLKGELSLVGPRPLLMDYLPLYSPIQARRHEVRPGITGWAQINGRNAISWDEKFELDVWYVDHQSFWLDVKILWLTLLKVLRSEGISQEGNVTMEKFQGQGDNKKDGA